MKTKILYVLTLLGTFLLYAIGPCLIFWGVVCLLDEPTIKNLSGGVILILTGSILLCVVYFVWKKAFPNLKRVLQTGKEV